MVEDFDEIGSARSRRLARPDGAHAASPPTSPISGSMCAGFALSERCHAPILSRGCDRQFSEAPMLYLTREEFRTAALTLGFKPAALRQWRHRRAIPPAAKHRLAIFFNDNFEIIEAPPAVPAGSTLAALAARYIR
jgi:hypothetical protein